MNGKAGKVCAILLATILLSIVPIASANIPPVADAEPDYQEAYVGDTVYFNGLNSYDPDGWIEHYGWDFGDGNFDKGNYTSHIYWSAGDYNVTLWVMDNENGTDTDNVLVRIFERNPWIIATEPSDGEIGVALDQDVIITFNEPINTSTFSYTIVPDPGGWSWTWSVNDTTVALSHHDFSPATTYCFNVTYAEDLDGNPLMRGPVPNPWCWTTISGPDDPPAITVYEPGGTAGQVFTEGDIIAVTWLATDDNPLPPYPINITYGNPPIGWTTLAPNEANDGIFFWYTLNLSCPETYWMRLSVRDTAGQTTFDTSNYSFDILCGDSLPHIEVIEPGGTPGQEYLIGDEITIFWDAYDDDPLPSNPINISYGDINGTWMPIVNDYPNYGLYDWNTTGVTPGFYWIGITVYDSAGQTSFDASDYGFELKYGDCSPDPPEQHSAILSGSSSEDVKITWELSADDGGGENDIAKYEILYSTAYAKDGSGYALLAALPPGTTTYIHAGGGDGNPNDYFYIVQAVDNAGQTGWDGQSGKYVRELRGGYKEMVSIPLVQADTSILEVIKTISGSYHSLMYYQGACSKRQWVIYKPGWIRDFHIDHKMGFFIKMLKDDSLVVAGLVPESTTITLCTGAWNLIGYPSFAPDTVGSVLSSISHVGVKVITQDRPQHMVRLSDDDMMSDGNGYWVKVLNEQVLIIYN